MKEENYLVLKNVSHKKVCKWGGTVSTLFLSVITLTLITEQEVPKMEGSVIRGTYQSDEALFPPLPSFTHS